MKTCNTCKEEKDDSCFYVGKTGKLIGYVYPKCKTCDCKKRKERYVYSTRPKVQHEDGYKRSLKGRITQYKNGAKDRGFTWELTLEEAALFWEVPCTYCGNTINGLGIDRVDSSIGYKLSNCVPCCTMCNRMKLNYDKDIWLEHIERIAKHQGF